MDKTKMNLEVLVQILKNNPQMIENERTNYSADK